VASDSHPEAVEFHCELCRRPFRIFAAQPLNRRGVSVSDGDDPRLLWLEIDLKGKFVKLVVTVEIVSL
jgi:hypothetical protein